MIKLLASQVHFSTNKMEIHLCRRVTKIMTFYYICYCYNETLNNAASAEGQGHRHVYTLMCVNIELLNMTKNEKQHI